eukprot:CAMPEP_0170558838 /NCGR_PEP_ID=MMETSP0211-20121228/38225_1 /TAXON_ID=311385 /ORGANISM="Pseudokeronopsis sp., Strain OXSARD2" /LENGTH=55 /DNA_ID=CAMNT_0010871195 /DNA_START=1883 /DNA_END=2050 /DNA_ORIENTATION=-
MPMLYQYKIKQKEEAEHIADEVNKEYKSGVMDPSRDVAMFEKKRYIKKDIGSKKT